VQKIENCGAAHSAAPVLFGVVRKNPVNLNNQQKSKAIIGENTH